MIRDEELDFKSLRLIRTCHGIKESRSVYWNSRSKSYEVISSDRLNYLNRQVFTKHQEAIKCAEGVY